MDKSLEEIQKALQAPLDEKYRREGKDAPRWQFVDAAYEQRMDEVFGFDWEVTWVENSCVISVRYNGKTIARSGPSFQDACQQFGVGRYLFANEEKE